MSVLTVKQISLLNELYAQAGADTIPGAWVISVPGSKIEAGTLPYAAGIPGDFATGAQGLLGAQAYNWGDHSVAGYVTEQAFEILTAAGTETTTVLTATPKGVVQVFYKASADTYPRLWTPTVDYTISGTTVTFVTVTPLGAGDEVHVYYVK